MRGREQTPGRRERAPRKWTLWASIGIVAAIVLMGATVAVIKAVNPDAGPSAPATPSASKSDADQAAPVRAADCPAGPVAMEGRLDVAPEAQWVTVGASTFPVQPGMEQPGSGVWECFDRTPEGAVLSAAAGVTQLSSPTAELREATIKSRVAPGSVQDEMLASAATAGSSDVALRLEISGFRLTSYDGQNALVDVAFSGAGEGHTVLMAMLVPLTWDEERGDWLMNYSENDKLPPVQLPSLAGYVLWSTPQGGVTGG